MSLEGRNLANYVIGKRIAEKRRAPLANAARKALDKATAKLAKQCGGDALAVCAFKANGDQINGSQARTLLERGETVTLKLWRSVGPKGDIFETEHYELAGECAVKL